MAPRRKKAGGRPPQRFILAGIAVNLALIAAALLWNQPEAGRRRQEQAIPAAEREAVLQQRPPTPTPGDATSMAGAVRGVNSPNTAPTPGRQPSAGRDPGAIGKPEWLESREAAVSEHERPKRWNPEGREEAFALESGPQEVVFTAAPEEEADEIFTIVEDQPAPTGGMQAFYKYVSDNLKYPAPARRMGIEGKVFVQFVVDRDGTLNEVQAVKGIGAGCDEEAVRVIQGAPKWNPGKQRGRPVRVRMILPITFSLGG